MKRECITCHAPTIVGREIDGNIRVIDEAPVAGGPLVALGDMRDQPTVVWGVDPAGETLPFGRDGITVGPDAFRYRLHECTS